MIDLVAEEAGRRAGHRRHPVRGHQVRSGPVHRQVRHRRRRHDDHRRAQEGHPVLACPTSTRRRRCWSRRTATVATLADLKGKKLGAQAATTGLEYAKPRQAANGYEIVEFQDLASQPQALLTGQVDAAINDLPVWTEAFKEDKAGKIKVAAQFDTGEQYGFGMKLGNDGVEEGRRRGASPRRSPTAPTPTIYNKWIGETAGRRLIRRAVGPTQPGGSAAAVRPAGERAWPSTRQRLRRTRGRATRRTRPAEPWASSTPSASSSCCASRSLTDWAQFAEAFFRARRRRRMFPQRHHGRVEEHPDLHGAGVHLRPRLVG